MVTAPRMPAVWEPNEVVLPTDVMTPERLALVVTVAALPLMEPVMRLENVSLPENVLLSPRSVVEATTMLAVPLKETPLMVRAFWSAVAVPALPPMESDEAVPVNPVPVAPRQIPYHAGYVYFELDQSHELWSQLKSSGGIALHVSGEFPGLMMELWAIRG